MAPLINVPTSRDIAELWLEKVFSRHELRNYTNKIYPYDVTGTQVTMEDLSQLLYCDRINFIQFLVQRFRKDDQLGCCGTYQYQVQIEYYREDRGEDQRYIQDVLELIDDLVETNLGARWDDTVTSSGRQTTFPAFEPAGEIENRIVYVGRFTYFAEASPPC